MMFFLFFLFWVIFNGAFTLEIALFGIVIAAIMYWFVCKFMDYSIRKDLFILRKGYYIIKYIVVLIAEILKANMTTIRLILSSKEEIDPVIVSFETHLKTKTAKVLLANSITLTPGTITVTLEDNIVTVHCLDRDMAEGMSDSVFVKMLEKLEAPLPSKKNRKEVHS